MCMSACDQNVAVNGFPVHTRRKTLLVPDRPGIATVRLVFPQMVCDGILSID
jgi:hypothetical protein